MFSFKQLQAEQIPWVNHNFPERPAWMPLMGLFEEFGEFVEASKTEEKIDAIADIAIFLSDFCTSQDMDLENLWQDRQKYFNLWKSMCSEGVKECCMVVLGKLAHHHLKSCQNIRGSNSEHRTEIENNIKKLLGLLDYICTEYDLINIVELTWDKVKKRDFKKNSINGIITSDTGTGTGGDITLNAGDSK